MEGVNVAPMEPSHSEESSSSSNKDAATATLALKSAIHHDHDASSGDNLLGFATPSEGNQTAESSSIDDFMTPPNSNSAEDLLGFASSPSGAATAAASEELVMKEDNAAATTFIATENLLGFDSLPVVNGTVALSADSDGQTETAAADDDQIPVNYGAAIGDLLDFASPSPPIQVEENVANDDKGDFGVDPSLESTSDPAGVPTETLLMDGFSSSERLENTSGNDAIATADFPPQKGEVKTDKVETTDVVASSDSPIIAKATNNDVGASTENTGSVGSLEQVAPPVRESVSAEPNHVLEQVNNATDEATLLREDRGASAEESTPAAVPPEGSMTNAEMTENARHVGQEVEEEFVKSESVSEVLLDEDGNDVDEMDDVPLTESLATNAPKAAVTEQPKVELVDPWGDPVPVKKKRSNVEPTPTIVDIPIPSNDEPNAGDSEKDALLVELQSSLQDHMTRQAEAEDRARKVEQQVKQLTKLLEDKEEVEKSLSDLKHRLKIVVSDKANLELELAKLRQTRDEYERKEIVLSNRLNDAKKKEAIKANLAEQLENEVKQLRAALSTTKEILASTQTVKGNLEQELAQTKQEMNKRVHLAETALADERRLNEDRKKKMKAFIETKQAEVRQGKVQTDELTAELEQTNRLLREQNSRWKQLHAQWVQSQTHNRELQRDLNRIKKDSDTMHKMGDKMEMKLSKSAQETEEHKNKRLTAKHELMTVLRTLEGEREVSRKLRDSLKFTFTPKALSQQQLLKESLQEFESELQNLSRRLGRPLAPSTESHDMFSTDDTVDTNGDGAASIDDHGDVGSDSEDKDSVLRNRSELDSTHLISNLEHETQRVSKCIMALMSSIERMHDVLESGGHQTCISALSGLFSAAASDGEQTPMTSSGRLSGLGTRSTRYGHVPTS